MEPINVWPFVFPFIRIGALLLMALGVGMFAAFYIDYRMKLMEYPMHERKRFRTLGFETGTVVVVALGSLVMFLPV
ncbi:hypothetical protein ACPRNU_20460 [Chromobacterium vaccinii]|uniref:hypothetical protein n=1 Tax=Chromobacterium vaccinii TaxID=1108595 RepID=UPI003C731E83